jgi:hypothetical protein
MDAAPPSFDPVAYLSAALTELDACAERAVEAARSRRADDALKAARMMQSLLIGRRDVLRQIEVLGRSKRVPLAVRRSVRNTARPLLISIERRVLILKTIFEARRDRAEALCTALRQATTTHSVYSRQSGAGTQVVNRTVGHIVAVSA